MAQSSLSLLGITTHHQQLRENANQRLLLSAPTRRLCQCAPPTCASNLRLHVPHGPSVVCGAGVGFYFAVNNLRVRQKHVTSGWSAQGHSRGSEAPDDLRQVLSSAGTVNHAPAGGREAAEAAPSVRPGVRERRSSGADSALQEPRPPAERAAPALRLRA